MPKFSYLDDYETLFEYLNRAGYRTVSTNKITHNERYTDQLDFFTREQGVGAFLPPKTFTQTELSNEDFGTVAGPLEDSKAFRTVDALAQHIQADELSSVPGFYGLGLVTCHFPIHIS